VSFRKQFSSSVFHDLRTHCICEYCRYVCVFIARTASENLKKKDRLCPHVGEPGSPLSVSQMLFRSLGARVARLLEWQATPEIQFLDFFLSCHRVQTALGPTDTCPAAVNRQRREAKLLSVSCLEDKKACRHFSDVFISLESWDSVVVVATSLRDRRLEFRIPVGARDSSP
jgi:hypothetical protein